MTPKRKYRSSRYVVLLPAGCSPDQTVALEQLRSRLAQLEKAYADLFGAGGSAGVWA